MTDQGEDPLYELGRLNNELANMQRETFQKNVAMSCLTAIVESSEEAIFSTDLEGAFLSWNAAAQRLYGYAKPKVLGRCASSLSVTGQTDLVSIVLERLGRGETIEPMEFFQTLQEGSRRVIALTFSPIRDSSGRLSGVSCFGRDITERKDQQHALETAHTALVDTHAQLERQSTQLANQKVNLEAMNARLLELATTDGLTGLIDHRTFQERLAEECSRATRYKTPLSLLLLDVDKFKQFNDTFGHPAGDAILKRVADILHGCARNTDIVARYGGEEFVIILTETEADKAVLAAERVRAAIEDAVWTLRPITVSIGICTLDEALRTPAALVQVADKALYFSKQTGRNRSTHWDDLSDAEEKGLRGNLTQPFTSIIAEMMQMQTDAFTSASDQIHSMMTEAYDATIVSWSRLLDLKDKETEGHSERVAAMMLKLATRIGMNAEELLYARWGSLLHDVGKMGVPDHILHKPGSLTEEEWVVMKSHTTIAYDLLSPVSFLRPALDIPYAHHEKWDGTGYPRGLTGDDIPLTARLFAIADVYDALTSDRPYRKAWSHEKAFAHVVSLAGTHFDPRAVKVFQNVILGGGTLIVAA